MKVKGNILLARRVFVVQHFGDDAWNRVLGALPAEYRGVLDGGISNVAWYPFELGQALDSAIAKNLADGSPQVFEELGAISARENLTKVHKDLLVSGDPQAFLARAPIVYRFYYDKGRREYVPTGPTSGTLTTYDAENITALDCLTVIGWYKEALKMCGAKEVSIREESCRARGGLFCRYDVRWTM